MEGITFNRMTIEKSELSERAACRVRSADRQDSSEERKRVSQWERELWERQRPAREIKWRLTSLNWVRELPAECRLPSAESDCRARTKRERGPQMYAVMPGKEIVGWVSGISPGPLQKFWKTQMVFRVQFGSKNGSGRVRGYFFSLKMMHVPENSKEEAYSWQPKKIILCEQYFLQDTKT